MSLATFCMWIRGRESPVNGAARTLDSNAWAVYPTVGRRPAKTGNVGFFPRRQTVVFFGYKCFFGYNPGLFGLFVRGRVVFTALVLMQFTVLRRRQVTFTFYFWPSKGFIWFDKRLLGTSTITRQQKTKDEKCTCPNIRFSWMPNESKNGCFAAMRCCWGAGAAFGWEIRGTNAFGLWA